MTTSLKTLKRKELVSGWLGSGAEGCPLQRMKRVISVIAAVVMRKDHGAGMGDTDE